MTSPDRLPDLQTIVQQERVPVDELFQRLQELTDWNEHLQQETRTSEGELQLARQTLELARSETLDLILKRMGWGICSEGEHDGNDQLLAKQGIFPVSELKYYFTRKHWRREYYGHFNSGVDEYLERLCPAHQPQYLITSTDPYSGKLNIEGCAVSEHEEELMVVFGFNREPINITHIPLRRYGSLERWQQIYEYFSLPTV